MRIGYGRVSTLDQDLTLQQRALEGAGCERIFLEKKSGAERNRPQLQRAFDVLRKGDTLVVWKLSRLARGLNQLIATKERLDELGVELVSLTESIDTTNPYGRAQFQFIGVLDELQREIIRENTIEGQAIAREKGVKFGRPTKQLTPEQHDMARRLLESGGSSAEAIAEQFGISRAQLYRLFPGGRKGVIERGE